MSLVATGSLEFSSSTRVEPLNEDSSALMSNLVREVLGEDDRKLQVKFFGG
jgi:hypothetical protein